MKYDEVLENARKVMAPNCRVCKNCNGRVCRGEVPGTGGRDSGEAFVQNRDYLWKIKILTDFIHEKREVDTRTRLFGQALEAPVFAAPVGGMGVSYNGYLSEEAYARALLNGCRDAGCLAFTGDGPPSDFFNGPLMVLKELGGFGIPTIKPWKKEKWQSRLDKLKEVDPVAVAMDIDGAGHGHFADSVGMEPKSVDELKEVIAYCGKPFIIKGIISPASTLKAVETGAAGIVVSNHGGRIFEHMPATARMLPIIRKAVGKDVKILVDGGVRSGADVFKMMALGADGVLIGRPYVIAAHGGGRAGVWMYTKKIMDELKEVMGLTGCQKLEDITEDYIIKES